MSNDPGPMRAALALARRGLGSTWPNPSVGCVILKGGAVVARGFTQRGGRPHAETVALERARKAAKGATVYVTLEPCCHHGKTPPCTEALISAGVKRVVVATQDPDPRVSGQGIEKLRDAGIAVELGLLSAEAEDVNAGFFSLMRRGMPLVSVKIASSLDGRIAVASRESRWITGEPARARVHLLRATHDAVMVGSGTVLADDPNLTCRLPGMSGRSPVRIVADGSLRVPLTARVAATAREVPTWFLVRHGVSGDRRDAFKSCGVEIVEAPATPSGETDLGGALQELGKRGITRLLVEGGATIATALLRADLVDRLYWFRAPSVVGADGLPALTELGLATPAQAPRFARLALETVGEDVLETLGRAA